jgi:hypothetical protein
MAKRDQIQIAIYTLLTDQIRILNIAAFLFNGNAAFFLWPSFLFSNIRFRLKGSRESALEQQFFGNPV